MIELGSDGEGVARPQVSLPLDSSVGASGNVVFGADILDAAPIGMALVERATGRVAWCNQAFAQLVGSDRGAVPGSSWTSLTGAPAPASAESPEAQEQVWRPGGDIRIVSIRTAAPEEAPEHLVHQVLDVTELRRASEALDEANEVLRLRNSELERSNQDLTEFAYVASHDLSEPLRVVAGHVELLAERYRDDLDPDVARWIDFAVDGCTRMRLLIEDLLRYSRAGRELQREPVSVRDVFEAARADAAVTIAARDAEVTLPDTTATVLGDRSQLTQVAANLLGNALKFVPDDRRPVILVTVTAAGSGWRIEVSDNGSGIEPRYRDRVFRVFQRLHPRGVPGTGIGLAICRRVVEEHGGSITVTDSELGGTTVALDLPAAKDPHDQ